MLKISHRWFKTLQYICRRYLDSHGGAYAASLTVDTLLSLVPLLATSIALFAINPKLQELVIQAEHRLLAHFVFDTGNQIQMHLEKLSRQAAAVSLIGAGFLVITSIRVFYSLQQAFKVMLRVYDRRKTKREIVLSCLLWFLAPVLVGIGIATSSFLISMPLLAKHSQHLFVFKPLLFFIPIVLSTLAFSFLYIVTPSFIAPFKYVFLGAFFAALLFEIAKWAFGQFLVNFPTYQVLYGALAAIPLFLLWLYVCWQIVLFGAIVVQALTYQQRLRSVTNLDGFSHALCWLGHLWQAKRSLSLAELVNRDKVSYQVAPEDMIEQLIKLDFIMVTKRGRYRLTRDIETYNLKDMYDVLPWKFPTVTQLEPLTLAGKDTLTSMSQALAEYKNQCLEIPLLTIYKSNHPLPGAIS